MTSILDNFEISSKIPQNIKIDIKSFCVFKVDTCYVNIIFVTKNDKVYGMGSKEDGLLGGDKEVRRSVLERHNSTLEKCIEIKELSNQRIKEIFLGGGFVLALTEDNLIFGLGYNDCGQLGRGNRSNGILKPQKIDFPSEEKIIDISCGYYHKLVLLENGLVYGWGWNREGQLGLNKGECVTKPEMVEINEREKFKYKYIYCYQNSSFAITVNGLLYSWGDVGYEHRYMTFDSRFNFFPRNINLLNVRKIGLDENNNNTYFLTNEGSIHFCDNKMQNTPKMIKATKKNIKDLEFNYCCDTENIFYHLNDGELEKKGEFESFDEFFAKELRITSKMIHICDEIENSNKSEFFLIFLIFIISSFKAINSQSENTNKCESLCRK